MGLKIQWHGRTLCDDNLNWKRPYINTVTGTWWVYDEIKGMYVDAHVPARGLQGDQGLPGVKGDPGRDGRDGTGVYVIGVDESSADGGINYVNFSDGTSLEVRNGNTGARGKDGKNGVTPVRGVDYWTAEDKQTIIEAATKAVLEAIYR